MTSKIKSIKIKRFRSLMDINLDIDTNTNFISICGENNTGKTNILRAINLFFNPELYDRKKDVPFHKVASGGGATNPEITIEFYDEDSTDTYRITRKFDSYDLSETIGTNNSNNLLEKEIELFLKNIKVFFIESINVSFPQLIGQVVEEVYEEKYSNTRLSGSKKKVRESYQEYQNSLSEVLQSLSSELTSLFSVYNPKWKIDFKFESSITKFVDLISDNIKISINDGSNLNVSGKGSGLQRLAYILLTYKIIKEVSENSSVIVLVDEPDVYLHHKLQRILKEHLKELSQESQVFLTTHSPVFIDTYTLSNVFLLNLQQTPVTYRRKPNETFYKLDTILVPLTQVDGINKIRSYLGIDKADITELSPYNLIVEGETDKIYLKGLCHFFNYQIPQIEVAYGADNIPKMLSYYDCLSTQPQTKPHILVLLDNDVKGREIYNKLDPFKFTKINISKELIPNFLGEVLAERNRPNIEIEDFIYPNLLAYCANSLLKKRMFHQICSKDLEKRIQQNAWKTRGILNLLEDFKNRANPNNGNDISFNAEGIKSGMGGIFDQDKEANTEILATIEEGRKKFPEVEKFLRRITSFE